MGAFIVDSVGYRSTSAPVPELLIEADPHISNSGALLALLAGAQIDTATDADLWYSEVKKPAIPLRVGQF